MARPLIDLDLPKAPEDCRIVVAMSGGVDSAVAAALLAQSGADVIGVTLQLYDHGEAVGKKGACCAGQDIHDARKVAERIGIAHYVLDYEDLFRRTVIDEFVDAYANATTPIPCVRCNQRVKFRDLLDTARDLGADALATGHYIRRVAGPAGPEMHRAHDPERDQSYFLFATTNAQLDFLRFPLGGMAKTEVRALAAELALPVADKPDSQDICFVPTGRYSDLVGKLRPGALDAGEIVHVDGRVLGAHQGLINYTVGQRRGLNIAIGEPLYVVKLDPVTRQVIVGPREALGCTRITLNELNWIGDDRPAGPRPLLARHRANESAVPARLTPLADGRAEIVFDATEYGVAPGQACVLYAGSRVLGGGWIESAPLAEGRLTASRDDHRRRALAGAE
ncbi:MAG: tRNA 2-thiouridine(34) synthase MnmA [Geminicoccaceae bacterium]